MQNEIFTREIGLIGEDAFMRLKNSSVIIFGVGGVGGYVLEALVRAGVGKIGLVDSDAVSASNINRQIIATHETIGMPKTEAGRLRALSINPCVEIKTYNTFYLPDTDSEIDLSEYDYIVDAVDTVAAKLLLARNASRLGIPFISCMGTANKLDPTGFTVSDIYKTEGCPLARVLRNAAKKEGLPTFKVVYSPQSSAKVVVDTENGRHTPASISYVPPICGFIAAGEVIMCLSALKDKKQEKEGKTK